MGSREFCRLKISLLCKHSWLPLPCKTGGLGRSMAHTARALRSSLYDLDSSVFSHLKACSVHLSLARRLHASFRARKQVDRGGKAMKSLARAARSVLEVKPGMTLGGVEELSRTPGRARNGGGACKPLKKNYFLHRMMEHVLKGSVSTCFLRFLFIFSMFSTRFSTRRESTSLELP